MFGRSFFDPSFRSLIRDVERTFDHLYQDMNRSLNPLHMAIPHVTSAAANDNGMYRLNIDMAGFRPEDIKRKSVVVSLYCGCPCKLLKLFLHGIVSVKGRVLTVQAKLDRKCDDGSRYFQEVAREYVLPESLQPDALKSILNDDGVTFSFYPVYTN